MKIKCEVTMLVKSEYTTSVEVDVNDASEIENIVYQTAAEKITKCLPDEACCIEGLHYKIEKIEGGRFA